MDKFCKKKDVRSKTTDQSYFKSTCSVHWYSGTLLQTEVYSGKTISQNKIHNNNAAIAHMCFLVSVWKWQKSVHIMWSRYSRPMMTHKNNWKNHNTVYDVAVDYKAWITQVCMPWGNTVLFGHKQWARTPKENTIHPKNLSQGALHEQWSSIRRVHPTWATCTMNIKSILYSPNSTYLVKSRHDTLDVWSASRRACRDVLFDMFDTAKMHGLDMSNVSCWDVAWWAKWNLGLSDWLK